MNTLAFFGRVKYFSLFQVRKLNSLIVEKKSSLAPIIKELRPMRQKCVVRLQAFS